MTAAFWRTGVAAALAYLVLAPSQADAKILLITSGDTFTHFGKVQIPSNGSGISPKTAMVMRMPGVEVGYKWSYGGLFWIDFWTWGGEYCLYRGNEYESITPEEAALLLGQSSAPGRPFLYKFPLGLLIIAGIVVLGVIGSLLGKKKEPEEKDDDGSLDQYRRDKE